ncbi:MAG: hemolysin family protein [Myxococcota bacterium]
MDESSYLLRFTMAGVLIFANAFFVATEFAFVGVRKSRVEALAKEGVSGANTLLASIHDLDRYIAGTQLGITIASLGLGAIAENTFESLLHPLFYWLSDYVPSPLDETLRTGGLLAGFAVAIATVFHVVLGELVPKSLALQFPEATALKVARPMNFVVLIMRPLIWFLNSMGNLVLRMVGIPTVNGGHGMVQSVEELQILVEDSHKQGVLEDMERFMLQRVFRMKDLVARQVMVHRLDVIGMPVEMPYEGLMLGVVDAPYSRFPVYEGDLDHIVGILFVKDLIGYRRSPSSEPFDLRKILRPALFVPESVPIETLLAQFKKARTQMAIVLDEFGGTSGLVTLEDVVEELLGDLEDVETSLDGASLSPAALRGPVVVEGRTRLDTLNERYGLKLEDDEADTIAGYVSNHIGRVPAQGERFTIEELRICVHETEGPRIIQLSLEPVEAPADREDSGTPTL